MTAVRDQVAEMRGAATFFRGLRPFVKRRTSLADAAQRLVARMDDREQRFRDLVEHAVFGRAESPYRKLFAWAHISLGDLSAMLASIGLESTLARLADAGVYVGLEEFKGLAPIRRPGLELPVRAEDFDNPLNARQYEARTGGSGGRARRIVVGLDLLEHESAYHAGFYSAHDRLASPKAMWLPAPPGAVGIKNALINARLGHPIERWFSQTRIDAAPFKHRAFAWGTTMSASLNGSRIPHPEHTPAAEVSRVAEWLARKTEDGTPGVLLTTPSAAVRVAAFAVDRAMSIDGTLFVLVGEPYTESKAGVIAAAGCTAASHYAMVESGMIGLACRLPDAHDDVHLVSDKMATIQRDRPVAGNGHNVPAFLHTSLLSAAPRMMLNVESGDYGVMEERECGCGVLPSAFRTHLHTIRSYEKLTSEGMNFMGTDLLRLIEHELPARYGGGPTDYQLVEREQAGVAKVSLVVNPAIGPLDATDVLQTTLAFLRDRGIGQRLMSDVWADGNTIEVVRREPHVTPAGKIQPLQRL